MRTNKNGTPKLWWSTTDRRDDTAQIVREYGKLHPQILLLENPGNRGKGYSVRNGMLHARGDICLFTDADLSSPSTEARQIIRRDRRRAPTSLSAHAGCGRNCKPGGSPYTGRRSDESSIWRCVWFSACVSRTRNADSRPLPRDAAQRIFPLQKIERWGFDPEILFLARRAGLRVDEVPVLWAHSEGTRLHPFRDGLRMFLELLRIRWNAMTGEYAAGAEPSPGKL